MSSTRVVVWEEFPESADDWHEKHQTEVSAKASAQSYFWEAVDNPFKGLLGSIDEPFLTVYEVPDQSDYEALEQGFRVDEKTPTRDLLKEARFDTRCYTQSERVQCDNYEKDKIDLQGLFVVAWQPPEGGEKELFDWMVKEFWVELIKDPLVLSLTTYKVQHATVFEEGTYRPLKLDTIPDYVTLVEVTDVDLPWEVLVVQGQTEKWREHIDGPTHWKTGLYSLAKAIPPVATRSPADSSSPSATGTEGDEAQ